jgi:hypothetical protein
MNSSLERQLGENLHGLAAGQPFEPDPDAIERRGRRYLRRRTALTRAGLGAGLAAVVAVGVTVAVQPTGTKPGTTPPGSSGRPQAAGQSRGSAPARPAQTSAPAGSQDSAGSQVTLTQLASYILAGGKPSGDATLVIRNQSYPGQPTISVADLYTDSGEYFFAHSVGGLPAQIASDHNLGDGLFAREIAAAVYADHGDLAVAREKMAEAPDPGRAPAPPSKVKKGPAAGSTVSPEDDYIWENSQDALIAGSGNPQVRAGVLRILSTLPEVTVTSTTTNGQPTLTLRAGAPAMPGNYQETLVVGAKTGVPVTFTGGVPGQAPGVTVTYQVSRVSMADIAAGKS